MAKPAKSLARLLRELQNETVSDLLKRLRDGVEETYADGTVHTRKINAAELTVITRLLAQNNVAIDLRTEEAMELAKEARKVDALPLKSALGLSDEWEVAH
jgi:hypothetical protein